MVDTVQAESGPAIGASAASGSGPAGGGAGRSGPERVGRRVALVIYAIVGLWVVVSGFRSVIPQVFWPAASIEQESAPCGPALESLTATLEEAVLLRPESVRREHLRAWDRRFLALDRACHAEPAYDALYRTRYAAETQAARHDDHLAPLLDEVRGSGDR